MKKDMKKIWIKPSIKIVKVKELKNILLDSSSIIVIGGLRFPSDKYTN
jgi:hypothetical protein